VVEKVLKLLQRKERWLVVAGVRFLRTCIGTKVGTASTGGPCSCIPAHELSFCSTRIHCVGINTLGLCSAHVKCVGLCGKRAALLVGLCSAKLLAPKVQAHVCLFCARALQDDFYLRHLIKNNLLDPVMEAFFANGDRYNLLNSAVLEMVEFIRKENLKVGLKSVFHVGKESVYRRETCLWL
jgi:hypothetical protein